MTTIRLVPAVILVLGMLAISVSPANAQCPAFGADTACGVVITVTNSGATVNSSTGQGPYDGNDDTLIGVVNNSNRAITSLDLTSTQNIFGFDGDGIDTFGAPGNSIDTTGYGGPNAYFTNRNGSQTSGRVNFITPIAAGNGACNGSVGSSCTAYFSLENALGGATACSSLLNNSVPKPAGGGVSISATFTPQVSGFTLSQAAQLCNFTGFDWQQTINSWPSPSPLIVAGAKQAISAPPPFVDPAPGGYTYNVTCANGVVSSSYRTANPFYYDPNGPASDCFSVAGNETSTVLSFFDRPADPCLPGPGGAPSATYKANKMVPGIGGVLTPIQTLCPKLDPAGSQLAFTTHLVGLSSGGGSVDLGIGFSWTSTFNGTVGHIAVTASDPSMEVDPGSGTGGITVTSYNGTTTYGGVAVVGVNGAAPGTIAFLTSGDSCNGVFTGTFDGDVTVSAGQDCEFINGTITGNVQVHGGNVVLSGDLIGGDVQINNAGTFSIGPFTTIEGNLLAQNLPSGAGLDQICGSTVLNNLQFQNNGTSVEIGSASPSACGGNVIVGNLQVQNNTAATSIYNNTVSRNLLDHDNAGATQVFGNTVTQNLLCANNSSISGGMNTAQQKQGQCAAF